MWCSCLCDTGAENTYPFSNFDGCSTTEYDGVIDFACRYNSQGLLVPETKWQSVILDLKPLIFYFHVSYMKLYTCTMRPVFYPMSCECHGPLAWYVKLRVAHAPGMPGVFSPPRNSKETTSSRSRHASRHVRYSRAVTHVGIANPRWRGKHSRHSRRMRNSQFHVSG